MDEVLSKQEQHGKKVADPKLSNHLRICSRSATVALGHPCSGLNFLACRPL